MTAQRFVSMRRCTTPVELGETLQFLLESVWRYLNRQESVTVGPAVARFHSHIFGETTAPADADQIDVEAGFPVIEPVSPAGDIAVSELPGGRVATVLYHGSYAGLPTAYAALEQFMLSTGITPVGGPFEIYWVDPTQTRDAAALRTEVVWPIAE